MTDRAGGWTGPGKYEPSGVVHRGEHVVPKEQVIQRTGLPHPIQKARIKRRNIVKMMLMGFWKPYLWKWFFNAGWRFFK